MRLSSLVVIPALAFLVACPPPGEGPGGVGPTGPGGLKRTQKVDQPSCGKVDGSDVGRKIYAYLVASAELDQATWELEEGVFSTCRKMALALGVSPLGGTAELCDRVMFALESNLEVSVSKETRLVTRTEPSVCTTEVDFAAEVAATCEAKVQADIDVVCDGYCSGSCNGVCQGNCAVAGPNGSCAGACDGVCGGRCTGGCNGHADVTASAECEASAEIRADVRTVCTEPKIVVVREEVTVVDATKLDRAIAAIEIGMPALLKAGAKATIVAKAAANWTKTAVQLVGSSLEVIKAIGDRGVCLAGELVAAAAASANISARIDVSISVSARVSAAAGGTTSTQ